MKTIRGNKRKNRIRGSRESDLILGLKGDDTLFGLANNDVLDGGSGSDVLDGGKGRDRLLGGQDSDFFIVDNSGDRTIEKANEGDFDRVVASVNWTLADNIEILSLSGQKAINGTGNNLDNFILGNDAQNTLLGNAGSDEILGRSGDDLIDGGLDQDLMAGGAGNDTYVVDNSFDIVTEKNFTELLELFNVEDPRTLPDAGGIDTVRASSSFDLLPVGAFGNIENLELTGIDNINGSGNEIRNFIKGNDGKNLIIGFEGDDLIEGGRGDDSLDGDKGKDIFSYSSSSAFTTANFGRDFILDFTSGEDVIALSKAAFGLNSGVGGQLVATGDFAIASSSTLAQSSNALIVFAAGSLYYNPNRDAPGFGVSGANPNFAFFLLTPTLSGADFLVV